MIVSIITTSDKSTSEIPVVIELFKNGLPVLHLRKSKFNTRKLKEYIEAVPKEYHDRIIIHSHHFLALKYNLKGMHFTRTHLKKSMKCRMKMIWYRMRKPGITITRSYHHLDSLSQNKLRYSYVFLNPFFSKTEPVKNHFDISVDYLKKVITENSCPIYASGNITDENLGLLKQYNVQGVAISKLIWGNSKREVEKYKEITHFFNTKIVE